MIPSRQQAFACVTAVMVAIASFNCWCHAGQVARMSPGQCGEARSCPNCCGGEHKHHSPDSKCQHCQGTVVSELATTHTLTPFAHFVWQPIAAAPGPELRPAALLPSIRIADSPLASDAPTLLRLHCALMN
jgi:hypothetical protein